jgi:hypothetical protein
MPVDFKKKSAARPPLPLVIASVMAAVAIWVPIYLYAGRMIWFW